MLQWLDDFFCALEGKTPQTAKHSPKGLSGTSGERMRQLFAVNGLDGWKDDKEKFKLDLINDIKTFLFGKWEKPWDGSVLFDANGKVISGFYNIHGRGYYDHVNTIRLAMNAGESPFFITGAQIAKQGGTVTDAKKWVGIISFIPIADDDNKDKIKFMLPKSHTVINVDFVNGIKKPIYKTVEFEKKELNEYIEAFIAELVKRKRVPKLHYDQADSCHYRYTLDFTRESIHLVNINQFSRIEGYYSTLFHEITHSTKNPDRCGRGKNATKLAYANEELVAEMGAMILCSEMGLEYTRQNSISYLKGWLKGVKGDSDAAMLEAYSYACDAAEYLLADIDLASLVPQSMSDRANNVVNEPEKVTEGNQTEKVTGEKTSPEPEITTNYYKINEESKVELYFSKEDYKKLDAEISKKIKSYFLFSRNRGAWVSKGTEARHLTDIAKNAGLVFKERDKRQTFAEELEKKKERAEGRIESSDRKIKSALKKSESLASEFNRLRKDWAWVTQPINNTSGGRAFARSKERVYKNLEKSFEEQNKAAYYIARRELAEETLSNKQLQSITYVQNRVKEATKAIKYTEKWIGEYFAELENKDIKQERADQITDSIEDGLEKLSYHNEKLAYYKLAEYDLLSKNEGSDEVVVYDREAIKELAKKLKVFIKKTTGETVQVTSSVRYITINLRPRIPNEIRLAMAKIIYPKTDWSNNDNVTVGNISTTYLSATAKEWAQLIKNHNPIEPKPTKKVTDENTSTRKAILDIPVSDIFTDEKRFQNRANAYSEDSANRIIKAVENGTFDWAKFDPIIVWFDVTHMRMVVLSGHSRFAAFKTLAKTNKEYERIPAVHFKGSEKEAIDLALNSNTLSTKETDAERAGYYHRMRQQCEVGNLKGLGAARTDCDKQVEAKCRDAEGKNANFILNLSYLAPRGYLMDSLHATGMERDNDSTNVLRTIANWIGEARRSFPQISDVHETEIAKWLLGGAYGSKAGQFRKKQDFLERVRVALSKFKGGADDSINIAQNVGKTSFEKEWEKRLDTAKTELAEAEKDHAERYAKYLDAVMHGSITNERMLELMKPLTANVQMLREAVDAIKKQHGLMREAEGRQKSLFGISDINEQFNDELDQFINGNLASDFLSIGNPSKILIKNGIRDFPIRLTKKVLQLKSKKHGFLLEKLHDLPLKIAKPVFMFKSKQFEKSFLICINDIVEGEGILTIVVSEDKINKCNIINRVASIGGRNELQIKSYINDKLLLYPEKEKALQTLPGALIAPDSKFQNLSANVIRNSEKTDTNIEINNAPLFGLAPLGTAKRAKTSRLKGDIGAFLGEYDRHCYTIALKGDKGAGKSRLMFQLVNAYAGARLKCAILSLEMSPESSVIQNYADAYIEPKNKSQIAITGESQDYASLSKICAMYDVVAIDSWNKVRGAVQTDFDRLQKEHPQCIIISIFQSTTGKVTRGGNMVEYDAGTVIQVNKGGHAVCEKNRYASTDLVYNVFDKQLEKEVKDV